MDEAFDVGAVGWLVLDPDPIVLASSNILMIEAIAGTKPCAPVGLTVTPDGTTLSLIWDVNTEWVHHYNVYRGPSADGPFTVIAMPDDSGWTDDGLDPGTYCYQVKAAFGPGDEDEGNESGAVCGIVPEPTP